MVLPNFINKHSSDSVFSPEDFKKYRINISKGEIYEPTENIILCYSGRLLDYVKEQYGASRDKRFPGETYLIKEKAASIGIIGKIGFGAPSTVTIVEELIALGVKRFISVGTAGTLQKHLNTGDLVVCDKAIRDEGTSYHYLEPSKYSFASREITDKIRQAMEGQGREFTTGTSWTIDAPYRETVAEVMKYQEEGVATVEMEASALFAVAKYRGVQMGAIFTISDSLADLKWSPEFHSEKAGSGLEIICRAAIEALSG